MLRGPGQARPAGTRYQVPGKACRVKELARRRKIF